MNQLPLNEYLGEVLSNELDRREFLAFAGAAVLAVFGVSGLIRTLTQMGSPREYAQSWYVRIFALRG